MSAIERWAEAPPALTDQKWGELERTAKLLAGSSLVPKALRGKPADVMAIGITAHDLGLPLTLTTLSKFFVADGKVEPSAQLMIGAALSRGHELWFTTDSDDDERATVAAKRRGSDRVQEFTFTVEQAEKSGRLASWYEEWYQTENGKRSRKWTIVDGETPPAWVTTDKIASGKVEKKRNEAWHTYRPDMLRAAAVRRACRVVCPDVLLGLPSMDFDAGPTEHEVVADVEPDAVAHAEPEDDDVVDGEIVEDDEPAEAEVWPADFPPEGSTSAVVDSGWRQTFAMACGDRGLTADERHAIIHMATSGRTATSKELRKDEVAEVRRWFRAVTEGDPPDYRFADIDGALVIVPRSADAA